MVIEDLGPEAFVHVEIEHQGERVLLVVRTEGESDLSRNDNVHVHIAGPTHVFASDEPRLGDG